MGNVCHFVRFTKLSFCGSQASDIAATWVCLFEVVHALFPSLCALKNKIEIKLKN